MPEQSLFDMVNRKRFAQQRIGAQINHAGGQVFAGPPAGVNLAKLLLGQCGWPRRDRLVAPSSFFIIYYCCGFTHSDTFLLNGFSC